MASYTDFPTNQRDDFFTIVGNAFQLIKRSWEAVKLNLTTFILIYLLPVLALTVAASVATPFLVAGNGRTADGAGLLLLLVGIAGALLLSILLTIASIVVQLASVRGNKIGFSEALNQSLPFFWRLVGLGFLSIVVITAGLILLIIPGLLAAFFLLLAGYVLIDQKLGVVDAMKKSYEITRANWKVVAALLIVQFVISLPSVVPVLGSIVTIILSVAYFCLPAIIYLRVAGKGKEVTQTESAAQ